MAALPYTTTFTANAASWPGFTAGTGTSVGYSDAQVTSPASSPPSTPDTPPVLTPPAAPNVAIASICDMIATGGVTNFMVALNDNLTITTQYFDQVTILDSLGAVITRFNVSDSTLTLNGHGQTLLRWPSGTQLGFVDGTVYSATFDFCVDDFNCDCEAVSNESQLSELRRRMLIQIGYAATASNPPAGIAAYCNEYLYTAQKQLYDKYKALRTERFYRWTMEPGQRYYGLADNTNCCTKVLDPQRITWVGFEDLNQAWYQLVSGINPLWYTRANIQTGWPTRYEIRSCIELFPAPQAAYTLWVKGHFGLEPFAADTDKPTIDGELVLLYAVANAKSDKGKPDAAQIG